MSNDFPAAKVGSAADRRPASGRELSVVIPTFRRPGPLREALQSVLGQQGVSVEAIVVDDDPQGAARAVVESLQDERVTYLKRAVPSGGNPSQVRNEGWPRATGRLVHFLDDDDLVPPGTYLAVRETFAAHPDKGVVFGRIEPFGDDAQVLAREQALFRRSARKARLFDLLHTRRGLVANQLYASPTVLVNSACYIRREGLERVGGYDEGIRIMEDVAFWLRAIRELDFAFLDRVVVRYRTGAASIMHDAVKNNLSTREAYAHIYADYAERFGRAELLAMKVLAKTTLRWL